MRRSRTDASLESKPSSQRQTGNFMRAAYSRRPTALCLAIAAAWAAACMSTARADDNSRFVAIEENDSIAFDSDKYYTQGLEFIYLGPEVAVDSGWIGPFEALDFGPFDATGA